MAAKTILLCCLFGVAFSATIPRDNIPVEIRYEATNSLKNLDAKVQLSPDELSQSLKHLPLQGPAEAELPLAAAVAEDAARIAAQTAPAPVQSESSQPSESPAQLPVESTQAPVEASPPAPEALSQPPVAASQPPVESSLPPVAAPPAPLSSSQPPAEAFPALRGSPAASETDAPVGGALETKLQQLRTTVVSELKRLRDSFKPTTGQSAPDQEQWASLEKAVDELFDQQGSTIHTKQSAEVVGSTAAPAGQNNNIFQNIMNGVTQLTSGWVANIQNRPQGAQSDAGTEGTNNPGGFQGFVQYFTNGVNNIINQISNNNGPTTSNTLLGDSGVTSSPSNNNPLAAVGGFFSSVANNVQQVFNGQNNSPAGTQGDAGSSPSSGPNPIQAIQNFGNSVGNAFNTIFQGQQQPATVSGDEGVPANGGSNVNIIQSIGNAIQNSPLNPFRPQSNNVQKPPQAAPQPTGTETSAAASPVDNIKKKPDQETPVVVEPAVPDKTEESQGENELDAKKETLVTSQ